MDAERPKKKKIMSTRDSVYLNVDSLKDKTTPRYNEDRGCGDWVEKRTN